MSSKFDILIKNATIIDGTGKPPYKGSIGVVGAKIMDIGELDDDAKVIIDASGLIASPGFIDAHSHADQNILWYPECESFVHQGVTTFVGGQCGGSPAPIGDLVRLPGMLGDYIDELDPYKYYPEPLYPLEQVNKWMEDKYGWNIDWTTMDDYFKRVDEKKISANYAPLVGHGTIRNLVLGIDYKRHATQAEIDEMIEHIHQAMKDRCIGMSTGMDYDPDIFASQDEIIQSADILKEYDGMYVPHWRRTGRRRDVKPGTPPVERIDGIKECIDVCRKTHVPLHIAHLDDCYGPIGAGVFPPELERASGEATLQAINDAKREGLPITFDYIPVPYDGKRNLPYLISLMDPWVREAGSVERLAELLRMCDYRQDVKDQLFAGKWHIRVRMSPVSNPKYWARNLTILKHKNNEYECRSIEEIARDHNKDPLDMFFDLIVEDPWARAQNYYRSDEVEKVFLNHSAISVCLDSSVFDDRYQKPRPPYSFPKEGTYDGFITILEKYVKNLNFLSVEEAIKKLSSNAANAYKIRDRGILKKGNYADVLLLDWDRLKVMSNSLEPRRYPQGIEYVFVNGVKTVEKGRHTGARAGKVLRKI